jgi:hypothetical protein
MNNNKIGIVKLWPNQASAEQENIERIKLAANKLGFEIIEIDKNGFVINENKRKFKKNEVYFVINLHFESPKCYEGYSYVALWNPIRFYFDWGYDKYSLNLISHDGFLSSGSEVADDHLRRLLMQYGKYNEHTNIEKLNHTLSGSLYKPNLDNPKIFYVGINWERLNGSKGRHHKLIKKLDNLGIIRIYGPAKINNKKVWSGFRTYSGQIPFDGISLIENISKCGISLVFSSNAHIQSGLMSNRLFESVSAGAVVICDDNIFAKENFGNNLLYVDFSKSEESIIKQVIDHYNWILKNKDLALKMAQNAQNIFIKKFDLENQLAALIKNHEINLTYRKNNHLSIKRNLKVMILVPIYNIDRYIYNNITENITCQTYSNFELLFFIENNLKSTMLIDNLLEYLFNQNIRYKTLYLNMKYRKSNIQFGKILVDSYNINADLFEANMYVIMNFNEDWFSENLDLMVRKFEDTNDNDVVSSDFLVRHLDDNKNLYTDFFEAQSSLHNWFTVTGNMMFSQEILLKVIDRKIYSKYLHFRQLYRFVWYMSENRNYLRFPTTSIDIMYDHVQAKSFIEDDIQERILFEFLKSKNNMIDLSKDMNLSGESNVNLVSILSSESSKNKQEILKLLIKSLKLPSLIRKVIKFVYKQFLSN